MGTDGNHLIGRPLRHQRAAALLLIALFFALATLMGALSASISAPASVQEGSTLAVSMTGAGALSIAHNNNVVATGIGTITHTMQTNATSAGLHQFTFTEGATSESRTVEVTDVPLTVTPSSPEGADLATNAVLFALETNWQPEFCYVTIDGASHTLQSTGPTAFSGVFTVADGVHAVDYKCKLGSEITTASKSIRIDTVAPTITATAPANEALGPHLALSVDTNEISQCRYGEADAPYDTLPNAMSGSYVLRNTAMLEVHEHRSYTYYVRCRDVVGNTMQTSSIISFLNKVPPSARIEIDGEEPLKAATYRLELETSVELAAAPTLKYMLQESGKTQQVALTGEGSLWTGYIVLPPDVEDTVLSFTFSGTSLQGVAGTHITEGTLFAVDAQPPLGIDSINLESSSSELYLQWYSIKASDHASYNIYRAEDEGVDYTDYFRSTTRTEFTDNTALASQYYYYRVAPVDAAGNVGPLSAEVQGSIVNSIAQESTVTDPVLLARIDEEIASLQGVILDANTTLKTLEEEKSPVVSQIIADMGLIEDAHAALMKLEDAVSSLRVLRERGPTAQETDAAIAEARTRIGEARHLLIKRITPQQQTETTQSADDGSMQRHLPYAIVGVNLSKDAEQEYLLSARTLQDRATITLFASSFTLYDASGQSHDYTFVRKRIVLQDPANNVRAIEAIPQSIAQAGQLDFAEQPIVLGDQTVQYSYAVLQQEEYAYVIKGLASLEDVKASRTLLYPAVPELQTGQEDGKGGMISITGNAVDNVVDLMPSGDGALIALGILIIIALGAYYVSLSEPKPKRAASVLAVPQAPVPTGAQRIIRAPLARPVQSTVYRAPDLPAATSADARTLLRKAEELIDEKQYDASLSMYKETIEALQHDEGLEQILHEETTRVYAKIILFKRLTDANVAAAAGNCDALYHALDDARTLALQIGDNGTLLMTEAKASYADFVRKLNALEIAQAGKY